MIAINGEVRKVIGEVTITLYEDGVACLEGTIGREPAPLTNVTYYHEMLRAGMDALHKHSHWQPRIVVPTR